jgi:hypothetical protein
MSFHPISLVQKYKLDRVWKQANVKSGSNIFQDFLWGGICISSVNDIPEVGITEIQYKLNKID